MNRYSYRTIRVLGADNHTHHNNKFGVYRTPTGAQPFAGTGQGTTVYVAAGHMAEERTDYVRGLFERRGRLAKDEERFLQALLGRNWRAADAKLRSIVTAATAAGGIAA